MSGNALSNASLLDGVTSWTATAGALSVDEGVVGGAQRGGPGRAVLVASRTATVGQTAGALSTGVAVTAGVLIEVAALYGSSGASELALAIYSGSTLISRTVITPRRLSAAVSRLGVPARLNWAYDLIAAPATGLAKIEVKGTATAAGVLEAWLSKPYLDPAWVSRPGYVWDPGVTLNVDIAALRRWPATLPPILLEGYDPAQTPLRAGWSSDTARESTSRIAGTSATKMRGQMRLSLEALTDLEQFASDGDDAFLFVRPDTQQLCRAQWLADGHPDPTPTGLGTHMVAIGLQLEVL